MAIFETILSLHPLIVILGFSFLVTLISIFAYKFFTNQREMKQLKMDLKDHQKEMKKHRGDQKKLMELQKRSMEKNLQYMKHSFRPMIFTFLPIILLFGWLHANLAYEPLQPGEPFNINVHATQGFNLSILPQEGINILNSTVAEEQTIYTVEGEKGTYTLFIEVPGEEEKTAEFVITNKQEYEGPEFKFKSDVVKLVEFSNEKMKPFGEKFNIFGYHPGWFIVYLVSAIVFNSILRKVFKIY